MSHPIIRWTEGRLAYSARWRSEAGLPPHPRVVVVDEQTSANTAYRLACEGTALLWRGDFQVAKQLLIAMAKRVDAKARPTSKQPPAPKRPPKSATPEGIATDATPPAARDAFNRHRLAQSQRARTLGMLLIPLTGDYQVPLRRAPDLRVACEEAYGPREDSRTSGDSVVSLREILGLIGAHEWRKKGVEVAALGARVHPHYGVFAPVRSEYVGLVAQAPLPISPGDTTLPLAFDIGTGTGVLAAVLAQRGTVRVIATDINPRALQCARENMRRLQVANQVHIREADLFPEGRAPLVVCNPPWIPARPSAPLEQAIYDADSQMLRGFIAGLADHLAPQGEGWLILSDLAERLGLRSREQLLAWFTEGGLRVIDRIDTTPNHPRVNDTTDPLHVARAGEVTSLWRLGASTSA